MVHVFASTSLTHLWSNSCLLTSHAHNHTWICVHTHTHTHTYLLPNSSLLTPHPCNHRHACLSSWLWMGPVVYMCVDCTRVYFPNAQKHLKKTFLMKWPTSEAYTRNLYESVHAACCIPLATHYSAAFNIVIDEKKTFWKSPQKRPRDLAVYQYTSLPFNTFQQASSLQPCGWQYLNSLFLKIHTCIHTYCTPTVALQRLSQLKS